MTEENQGASGKPDRAGGLRPEPAPQSQPKALIPCAGTVTWHSSEEDGGPDVGVSLALDQGAELWCGEISRKLWEDAGPELAEFGDDGGSWLVVFGPGNDTTVVGKVEYHSGRALLEYVLAPLLRGTDFYAGRYAERCGQLLEATTVVAELAAACEAAFDFLGGIDGAAEARDQLLRAILAAQAIEARRAETQSGSVHESAVGNADAPEPSPDSPHHGNIEGSEP